MNKFEQLTHDYHKLRQEYEFIFRLKRKLEKENIKLKKDLKALKIKIKQNAPID